jgi:hypothetical protein
MFSNFSVIRESACLELRKNQLAIDADFKAAAIGWNKSESFDSGFQVRDQLFGQTDRLGFVLSNLAVDNFDFQFISPP